MCWLMVLPSGRWNGHCRVEDGKWLMLLPLGRCYSPGSMFILILVLGCYTEPHPIYVADGIYQHFCLGMDYWPWYKELLLWLSWGSGPPSLLCWSVQHLCCDQWCYSGQIWERGSFDVPWTSLQRSLRTLLYIPHCIPPYHIYSCRWPHSFSSLDPSPWGPSGGS